MGDAEEAERPASRSSSSQGRCSCHATRLCTCSTSTRPNQPSWRPYCPRPRPATPSRSSSARSPRSRRRSSAAPRERSAPPYIGDESTRRTCPRRAPRRRLRARAARRRRTSSRCRARRPGRAAAPPSAQGALAATPAASTPEERGVLVRPAAHVREQQARARLSQPWPSSSVGVATLAGRRSSTARAWCETPRCRSRGSASDVRTASAGGRRAPVATCAAVASESARGRARSRPDDPGADAADDRVVALRPRPGERRGHGHELGVGVGHGATAREPIRLRSFRARTVSERAPAERRPRPGRTRLEPPRARARLRDLAVQRAEHDRHASGRRQPVPSPPGAGEPAGPACAAAPSPERSSSGGRPRPRVRLAYTTSKPPEPSSSRRACSFTSTSSPTSTGPVSRGYATGPDQPVDLLRDRGDLPPPKREQHIQPLRQRSTEARCAERLDLRPRSHGPCRRLRPS